VTILAVTVLEEGAFLAAGMTIANEVPRQIDDEMTVEEVLLLTDEGDLLLPATIVL
jgi:hypothetical protein